MALPKISESSALFTVLSFLAAVVDFVMVARIEILILNAPLFIASLHLFNFLLALSCHSHPFLLEHYDYKVHPGRSHGICDQLLT